MTVIHDPGNTHRIDNVWVFVSRDENGNEGVIAAPTALGVMPLIAADSERLESLRPLAKSLVDKVPGKKVALIKLTTREEIEVFE